MAQTINVDVTPSLFQPTLYYHQGDIGREFAINISTKDGYEIPSGATVKIEATKPSGLGFSVSGTLSGDVVSFVSTEGMTDEWGRFPAQLEITSGNTVIYTANFLMVGEKNTHPDSTVDGSQEDVIPQLTLLVERVENAAAAVLDTTTVVETLPAGSQATYSFDEETNTATFGIPEGEAGAGAAGVVASAYSASKTYAVGDYVIHNSNLYRCNVAITTAESFTASHWTQVVLADDVTNLKSDIGAIFKQGVSLDENSFELGGWGSSIGQSPWDVPNSIRARYRALKVLPNTSYLMVAPSGYYCTNLKCNNNKILIAMGDGWQTYWAFTTPKDCAYIYFTFKKTNDGAINDLSELKNGFKVYQMDSDNFVDKIAYSSNASEVLTADLNNLKEPLSALLILTNSSNIANIPSDYPLGSSTGYLITNKGYYSASDYIVSQMLFIPTKVYAKKREYNSATGSWENWSDIGGQLAKVKTATLSSGSLNDVTESVTALFFDPSLYTDIPSTLGTRVTTYYLNVLATQDVIKQFIFMPSECRYWIREKNYTGWESWAMYDLSQAVSTPLTVHVGAGRDYETIREAVAVAETVYGSTVIVHPGNYDLAEEFATELAQNPSEEYGIPLQNGIKLFFYSGAYVTANITLDATRRVYFAPFHARGSFEIEGLNIEVSNTRYCVHEDMGSGSLTRHFAKFKDCIMKNHSEIYDGHCYYQCIGGGMSVHSYVLIENCIFDSAKGTDTDCNAVSYHNGDNADCDGTIFVNGCLFKNGNGLSIQYYGTSPIISKLYAHSNSFGRAIQCVPETVSSVTVNMAYEEWLNEVR